MSKRQSHPQVGDGARAAGPGRGFTLIELLVTVAIVAILAAIAYPAYTDQIRKTRRTDAQAVLMQGAQFMERSYPEKGPYTGAGGVFPYSKSPIDGTETYYNITSDVDDAGSGFTVEANPAGAQDGDGKMDIDNLGTRRWDRDDNGTYAATEETWQ
jgi:type IV pilus assembly protein PilE